MPRLRTIVHKRIRREYQETGLGFQGRPACLRLRMKLLAASIVASALLLSYYVQRDREQTRKAAADRFDQTRQDERERVARLEACVAKAEHTYFQQSLQAAEIDKCPYRDVGQCTPISRTETLEWQKRALDEALASKTLTINVCIAEARPPAVGP
jgi:hypothetical protein